MWKKWNLAETKHYKCYRCNASMIIDTAEAEPLSLYRAVHAHMTWKILGSFPKANRTLPLLIYMRYPSTHARLRCWMFTSLRAFEMIVSLKLCKLCNPQLNSVTTVTKVQGCKEKLPHYNTICHLVGKFERHSTLLNLIGWEGPFWEIPQVFWDNYLQESRPAESDCWEHWKQTFTANILAGRKSRKLNWKMKILNYWNRHYLHNHIIQWFLNGLTSRFKLLVLLCICANHLSTHSAIIVLLPSLLPISRYYLPT